MLGLLSVLVVLFTALWVACGSLAALVTAGTLGILCVILMALEDDDV